MSESFVRKIQKGEIKAPTQRGFKIKQWNKSWKETEIKSDSDRMVYESGKMIDEVLSELRAELEKLYKQNAPKITYEELLKIYFSISNRDRSILDRTDKIDVEKRNIFSQTLSSNAMGNEVTLQEIADSCVDGLEKAIFFCKKNIENKNELKQGSNSVNIIDFVRSEANLSQMYKMYESYWQALLWSEYKFNEIDKKHKIFCITQPKTEMEIGSFVSQIRKSRLSAQTAMIASKQNILNHFQNDKCIVLKKVGRKKSLISVEVTSKSDQIQYINSDWKVKELFLSDEFPEEILEQKYNNGFSILEALNVFRCLMILSYQYTDNYPNDDSAYNKNKLLLFCPKIKKLELTKGLVACTGYKYSKITNILNFLEYNANENEDLWCHPIISTSSAEYLLLTSSLATPVIVRIVEHWLVRLKIDMQDKGDAYEKTVIGNLNKSIISNKFITDYEEALTKRIKITNGVEEIDLIARVGNVILIGEIKSIVTTDSSISQFRTIGTLKHAASQVKRKAKFVQDNLTSVFSNLGWEYEKNQSFKYAKFIINSGRMYAGFSIDGIPVCDEKILEKYFYSKIIPLFSIDSGNHIAWFNLYNNFNDLQDNLCLYLNSPPQINKFDKEFEYKTIKIPSVYKESYKILIKRLTPKNIPNEERLKYKYPFPLEIADNIEEVLSNTVVSI